MENHKGKDCKNEELLLEQWKTCVEMANATSQRRDAMNNIFVTLNLAIITAVSLVWNLKSLLILIAGVVVCIIWLLFIRNFKLLNTAKFNIINALEKQLPSSPFLDEWNELKKTNKYYDGTKLERILPGLFICLYFITSGIIVYFKLK